MIAFFAIIVGVNAFMAHAALTTFGGVETASSYQAGQTFEREVALAKLQDAQHWQVDAKVTREADGTTGASTSSRRTDPALRSAVWPRAPNSRGRPIGGSTVASRSVRPGQAISSATLSLPPANGTWSSNFRAKDERLFRSKNRVILK